MDKRFIGLDPGLRFLGWGVIEVHGNHLRYIACGAIRSCVKDSFPQRLVQLEKGLEEVFDIWHPHYVSVEKTFVNRDAVATLKLGQARSICLLVPARRHLPIVEYAPNLIKRTVTGYGHADKTQILGMIKRLLPSAKPSNNHEADALAVAITHAHMGDLESRISTVLEKEKKIKA